MEEEELNFEEEAAASREMPVVKRVFLRGVSRLGNKPYF